MIYCHLDALMHLDACEINVSAPICATYLSYAVIDHFVKGISKLTSNQVTNTSAYSHANTNTKIRTYTMNIIFGGIFVIVPNPFHMLSFYLPIIDCGL